MSDAIAEFVKLALEKAILQKGEIRLVSKGAAHPGLFLGGPASAARTEAINVCFSQGLLEKVREVQEGKGKSAKKALFVKITNLGMRAVFENSTIERGRDILKSIPHECLEVANGLYLEVASGCIQQMQSEIGALLKKESDLFSVLQTMINERANFISQSKAQLQKSLDLAIAVVNPDTIPAGCAPDALGRAQPQSEGDLDFQRDQSEQLVFAWKDAEASAKHAIENIMFNLGLEPIGERGQPVHFDGLVHETDDTLEWNEEAIVTDPGWRLSNSRGVYLICKTRVRRKEQI